MRLFSLSLVAILLISVIGMGCTDDDSNQAPFATLVLEPNEAWIYNNDTGIENPEITFNATGSQDPDGEIANYRYDFGEGNFTDSAFDTHSRAYPVPGFFSTGVTVQDNDGEESTSTRPLTVNYRYLRQTQVLESSFGTSDKREHPFPVSPYHPFSGTVRVDIEAAAGGGVENPNANVTVYNRDDDVVAHEQQDNIQGNVTIIINLGSNHFDQFGTGEWTVTVAVENGSITYDVHVQITYRN